MILTWIAALLVLTRAFASADGLRSSGNEFYIPFWFDEPGNDADATLLYFSTNETITVMADIVIHLQNRTTISIISHTLEVSPSSFTIVRVKEWLSSDLGTAKDRVPEKVWQWWLLINFVHIKVEGNREISVLVLNRIYKKMYTYQPFPVSKDATSTNVYYVLPQPLVADHLYTVLVIIVPFNNTDIILNLLTTSVSTRMQRGLVKDEKPYKYVTFLNEHTQYRITAHASDILVLCSASPLYSEQDRYVGVKITATKPILLFTGAPTEDYGYLTYQQIPPVSEWGYGFIAPPVRKVDNEHLDMTHYFRLVASGDTKATSFHFTEDGPPEQHTLTTEEGDVARFETFNAVYYVVSANNRMWVTQGYSGSINYVFSVLPSVEHYANSYKFPAAGRETEFAVVDIKLLVPLLYFQPQDIILDGESVLNHGIEFDRYYINGSVEVYIAEYKLDANYSTYLNNSNMHLIYHKNSTARFGLLVTSCSCANESTYAFPGGFAGSPPDMETDVLSMGGTQENGSKPAESITKNNIAAIVVSITLGIVAVAIAGVVMLRSVWKRYRKKQDFRRQKLISMDGILEMKEPDPTNCEYDVFISFADENHNFVEQHIYQPLEEQGFKVCWHHRDFAPGYSIIENIKNSIDKSRRVILVFSEHFHKSEYCLFELRYSCERMLATHSQMVIPIVLHEDSFPRELDHITYWKFSVESPEENDLQSLIERLGTRISESQEVAVHDERTFDDESDVLYML